MESWYGKFDILFTGATINCDSSKKIVALQNYLKHKSPSYQISLSAAENEEELRDILWYNTTYIHEARHVHDYLLCPILNYGYRLRLMMAMHTLETILLDKNKISSNIIPIPFQKWIHLSPEEKEKSLLDWSDSSFKAKCSTFTVPKDQRIRSAIDNHSVDALDDFTKLMVYGAASYEEYANIHKRKNEDQFRRPISVSNMLESSAVCCQLLSANQLYGDNSYNLMVKTIEKASQQEIKPNRFFSEYTTILSYINSYLKFNNSIGRYNLIVFTPILITWCFSGNLFDADAQCDPIIRLHTFIENDFAKGITIEQIMQDPLSVFCYWDKKIDNVPLNFAYYLENNYKYFDTIAEQSRSLGMHRLSAYAEMVGYATRLMAEEFIKNPIYFLFPDGYIYNFHNFPNIPLRFILPKNGISTSCMSSFYGIQIVDEELETALKTGQETDLRSICNDMPSVQISSLDNDLSFSMPIPVLRLEKCNSFIPFFRLSEAIYQPDTSVYDSDDLSQAIFQGLAIRYLLD